MLRSFQRLASEPDAAVKPQASNAKDIVTNFWDAVHQRKAFAGMHDHLYKNSQQGI